MISLMTSAGLAGCGGSSAGPTAGCGGGSAGPTAGCGGGSGSDAATIAEVKGTLTFPSIETGKFYWVEVTGGNVPSIGACNGACVAHASGRTTNSTSLTYSIANVPAGTYFLVGFVDVDGSGSTGTAPAETSGDWRGWYGLANDFNPPTEPNAAVPQSSTAVFDFGLGRLP